jgi:plasmid stabilization system protein ParE
VKAAVFHPEALIELQEQAVFYEERGIGLGEKFNSQIDAAIQLAVSMPGIGSPHLHGTRRVFPKDFPHAVVYLEAADRLVIIAVAPFRRKPAYWQQRK